MRVGITILPEHRWAEARPRWVAAEEYGFDHAWTFDHLAWGRLADHAWYASVPTLALAAEATSRIRLGLLVASPNFRHPVPFTRDVTTLDEVSDGRFTLGVGAGGMGGYDANVLGAPAASPHRRFAEFLELLDRLLTTDRVDHAGEHYAAVGARNVPGCVQRPRPPFVVAANGPKGMRLAARFGRGWVTTGLPNDDLAGWWDSLRELSGRLDDVLDAAGLPRDHLERHLQSDMAPVLSTSSVECYRDFVGRAGELGFTDLAAPWPRDEGVFAGDESVVEAIAAEVLPGLRADRR
ncbi:MULTISPECIES: LLM class flavin-dependent oxidoreductase [Actinosynnema]|uniref:LLM class flavin-dependent oxidoreductase n=1 Tax=Actinosynnema pretiosum TaxID=42197 RepID=A0A290ZDG9_9PSEU|nr:LLM class flavin-dependent oxidoreductase [Actinosynnema pretiosum]ATE57071.1 LLM class flavin-dependent oxidoreductase [Actinosynnema pretiosum]